VGYAHRRGLINRNRDDEGEKKKGGIHHIRKEKKVGQKVGAFQKRRVQGDEVLKSRRRKALDGDRKEKGCGGDLLFERADLYVEKRKKKDGEEEG